MFMKIVGLRCRLTRSATATGVWNASHYNNLHSLYVNNYYTTAISQIKTNDMRYFSTDKVNKLNDDDDVMKKMLIYGMKNIRYEKTSVLKLTRLLKDLVEENKSSISARALSNMFYALKDMSSNGPEVLEILKLMIVLSKNCNGPLVWEKSCMD